jgi:fumarylacetoacetase
VTTWVNGAAGSGYDVTHLPYGVFSQGEDAPRVGVRVGDFVLDLAPLAAVERLDGGQVFEEGTLNAFMTLGRPTWDSVRGWLTAVLTDDSRRHLVEPFLVPLTGVTLHLPFEVADYVDFYCSLDHASNVGRILRPDAEPLLPNWRHLPVAYHGRAGTVVVSGTPVTRPCGQRKPPHEDMPTYGATRRLDVEAEVGFVVGRPSAPGTPVGTGAFADHVFGVLLVNDWSARDIQAWEYVPLGPFLGKSFATSVAAWVTPLAALEQAKVDLPAQDPPPLPYLQVDQPAGYDIAIEVELNGEVVSRPPYSSMYWSPAQMLAHLTVNGASLRTGDLFASGTVSGPDPHSRGSFLELSWGGREPFTAGGRERSFLEDGDEVVLRATAPGAEGTHIALGEVRGRIEPAAGRPGGPAAPRTGR